MEEQIKQTDFDRIAQKAKAAMEGNAEPFIPIGFPRLSNHIEICQRRSYLVGGYTGSGKSTLVNDMFILQPYDWFLENKHKTDIELKIICYSMERSKDETIAKWALRKLFIDTGVIIPLNKVMGRTKEYNRLTASEYEAFMKYKTYIDGMLETGIVEIFEGHKNPMGIKKYIDDVYAPSVGKKVEVDANRKKYVQNNPKLITLIIKDHLGLLNPETREGVRYGPGKEIIDLSSKDDQRFRDYYGFSVVNVSQFNREIANPMRIKQGDTEPRIEDFKDSGGPAQDADIVLALFDPWRYKVPDPAGYNLEELRDKQTGIKKYRYLSILKNTYGGEGFGVGLAFQPAMSCFKEMPKRDDVEKKHYDDIINNNFFLKNYSAGPQVLFKLNN